MNKMCFDYANIIACDIANELLDITKNNKKTTKYNSNILDYLKKNTNNTFYITNPIDRYEQIDDTKTEKKDDCNIVLSVDNLPICLISTNYDIDDNKRLSYNYYLIEDNKFKDIVSSDSFYILNASDYGLYIVNDNDYYTISYPLSENNNFMEDVKKLNISLNKVNKDILDLDLLDKTNININIKDYDYSINEDILNSINSYLLDNDYKDCKLIGSIPNYQYYFSSLNNIEVVDYDRENDSYHFKLVKDNKVLGHISYDSFDEEVEIYEDISEADNYYVNLVGVGHVYIDKVVSEDNESYSYIDDIVIKAIQEKIKKDKSSFNEYYVK